MSYSSNMAGLDLFTAPFGSSQAPRTAAPTRLQQPTAAVPQHKEPVSSAQTARTNPPVAQAQQPDVPFKSVPEKKTPAVQLERIHTENAKVPEPEKKPQEPAPAPVKVQPSADTQAKPEQPHKELSLDMSDRSIPAGKPLDASEEMRRKAHEEAEAKRKAEWETKQAAKKQAEQAVIQRLENMSDADIVSASTERVRTDVERLTRRNMKECVAGHIQSICKEDPAFARKTMHPRKSMIHCFQYINRMAKDFIQQEMKDNDIKPENGVYGGDVPDGMCYQWAVDYFNDSDTPEDRDKEEKFEPRPYAGTASKPKKTAKKKDKKEPEKKQEPKKDYEQISLPGV